ncbi:leucine--tRNA ligase [Candidatus Saccharibacteria bacterium]|nr:leucine--tRNA ligase [Candidatus Saccharibacteria bacterium]
MKRYNPKEIEPKWQQVWSDRQAFVAQDFADKPKTYISCMFPYPSGAGMHTGHIFEHAIVDAIARFSRANGHEVMNPMGWDSFGLPAENYAIKTGTPPQETTKTNIANFRNQLQRIGASIDWTREINTSDPEYYRWTQWVFTKFFERGLAYQKDSLQWWCPIDQTVLANEQVVNGKCWRHDGADDPLAEKKNIRQWFFKITDYADALLEEIPALDWPDKIKAAQTNWIGKSQGAEVTFAVDGSDEHITVFTTRPDTIFGATFIVLAPEHPLARTLAVGDYQDAVEQYVTDAVKKTEIDRLNDTKEKTGVFTGSYAINPANKEKIPIWVADYVLYGYGTGAIMAVPAHDERDKAFADRYELPVIEVIDEYNAVIHSSQFDGQDSSNARETIVSWLEELGVGQSKVTYKMRDWLISRQRYWGAPIPIIHCDEHGAVAVPEDQLPVVLPVVEDFAPKGDGKSVLAHVDDWVNVECPTCGKPSRRETDTMDGYACSSWYLLRYTDPQNTESIWDSKKANYWAPVDFYVGGDHAVAHLLYVRFWTHVFNDMGLVNFKEPVKKLVYHGLISAEDGRKMSKSLGNTVDPLDIIDQGYGADALRTFELFLGPIDENSNWSSRGIAGIYRFLNRVWTLTQEYQDAEKSQTSSSDDVVRRLQHKTIRKVTDDYRRLSFNTAIAAMMEYVNDLYKLKNDGFSEDVWRDAIETLLQLLAPLAPHMSEELWQQLGHDTLVHETVWPVWDDALIVDETITIAVQVNGKLRATVQLPADSSEEDVKKAALGAENVIAHTDGKEILKVIYIPKKLVNIVVK